MSNDEIEKELTDFIVRQLLAGDGRGLTRQTELLEMGVLNSMNIVLLLSFLEERFQFQSAADDVLPENIGTIERLTEWVSRRKAG